MGVFLYVRSAAFAEDLEIEEDAKDFNTQVDQHFARTAYNCWIAALLYVGERDFIWDKLYFFLEQYHSHNPFYFTVSFAFSVHQYFANRRVQHSL